MPFDLTVKKNSPNNAVDAKRAAMEAAKAAKAPGAVDAVLMKYIAPTQCPDRNHIVFDDSGSMGSEIANAKKGVVEYLRNCIPNQTAVALYFMNSGTLELQSDLISLATAVEEKYLKSGHTPFFNTLKRALQSASAPTRLIAFTDGAPTDQLQSEENEAAVQGYWSYNLDAWKASANIIIKIAHAVASKASKCIPIDTVYFGPSDTYTQKNIDLLKYLSEQTGGFFLHFDPAKVNFRTAFKYLAPVNRLALTDGSFRAALERGEKQ